MQDIENKNDKESADGRIYEIGYLLVPTISEEDMPIIYGNLKDLIVSQGGAIIFDEMPKMLTLAYKMSKIVQNIKSKFDTAYFGWTKFEIDPEKISDLKKNLDLDPNFLRFLVLKTVRENTIAAKRFIHKDSRRKISAIKKDSGDEVVVPINKEEIDKEIEAMVAI